MSKHKTVSITRKQESPSSSFVRGMIIFAACLYAIPQMSSLFREGILINKQSVLFVPPVPYVKMMSGTFESFFADLFYIRGMLAISDEIADTQEKVEWVQQNFHATLELDPQMTEAYFFGGVVIAKDEASIKKGIEFLEKNRPLNPALWKIPYWIGFNYYQLGNYLKAIEYYEKASRLPKAMLFLKKIQPMLYYQAGESDLGIIYLESFLNSLKDDKEREAVQKKIEWLKGISFLEQSIARFKAGHGSLPPDLETLVRDGMISDIPKDPFGHGYYLEQETGKVKSKLGDSDDESEHHHGPGEGSRK